MKQESPASPIKSCLDCVNCKAWDIPGTLEDPPEQGWKCQHPNIPDEYEDENPEEFAQNCPFFQMIDFQAMAQAEL